MTTDEARQLAAELDGWFTTEDGKKYRGFLLEAATVLREQADEIDRLEARFALVRTAWNGPEKPEWTGNVIEALREVALTEQEDA